MCSNSQTNTASTYKWAFVLMSSQRHTCSSPSLFSLWTCVPLLMQNIRFHYYANQITFQLFKVNCNSDSPWDNVYWSRVRIQHIIIEEKKVIMLCLYIIISENAHPGVFNKSSKEGRKILLIMIQRLLSTHFSFSSLACYLICHRMGKKDTFRWG